MGYFCEMSKYFWVLAIQSFLIVVEFWRIYQFLFRDMGYVGHPISSDNGLISQNLLLKSKFYYPMHVAMGVAYSCLK